MKSKKWKRVGVLLALLVIFLVGAALIIPRLIDPNQYNGLITAQVEKAIGGKVNLGPLDWGIANGIWLEADGFTAKSGSGFLADLDLERIYARVSILPLLSKKVVVEELLLERPVVALRLAPSSTSGKETASKTASVKPGEVHRDITASTGSNAGQAGSSLPVDIVIREISFQQGRVKLEDTLTLPGQKKVHAFTDVTLEANNLIPGEEIAFEFALRDEARLGVGVVKGQGTFKGLTEALTLENPELKVKATIESLDTEVIKPYLQDNQLVQRMGGKLSLEVHYQGDFGKRFSAEGQIDLSHFAYTDPSLWETSLPGVETTLTYQIKVDPEQLRVKKLDLKLGNLFLTVEALLQNWRQELVIKKAVISSDLSLAELTPLIPWRQLNRHADTVRQLLAGGGKVIIERATLPEFTPSDLSDNLKGLLYRTEGSVRLSGLSMKPSAELPRVENITGTLQLEKGVLSATEMQARLGPLTLPTIDLKVTNLVAKPRVSVKAKGPMRLVGTSNTEVEKLLKQYGLKSLTGTAEIDMQAHYDQAKPQNWNARGYLVLVGIKAETHPAGVRLKDLQGRVRVKRQKALEITVENLVGKVNQALVQLDAKLAGIGSKGLVVDAKAKANKIDLAELSALMPPLRDYKLGGKVDMDIDVHYPHRDPMKSRVNGKVKTSGVAARLVAQGVTVADADAEIELSGNSAVIRGMTLRLNEQKLTLSGKVSNFRTPKALVQVNSPYLNLDRLLPATKEDQTKKKPSLKPEAKRESGSKGQVSSKEKPGKAELPPLARKLTTEILLEVKRGEFRDQRFQDLKLKVNYERGVLKSHELDVLIAGGRVATKGSMDLRNLERIPFTVEPAISTVRLESIVSLLGVDEVSVQGPLTMTGRLQGRTGSTPNLLKSLQGRLAAQIGRGRIYNVGPMGSTLAKLLTFISLKGLLSGRLAEDLSGKGISFDSIDARATFEGGNMRVSDLHLQSSSLQADARGTVDLVNQQLNMKAHLETSDSANTVLSLVPVLGEVSQTLANLDVKLQGPVANPRISLSAVESSRAEKRSKKETESPDQVLEGVFKGLEKVFGR